MTVTFADMEPRQCRCPVSGEPGPTMMICGEPTEPGASYCRECRSRLYYQPTKRELKSLDATAGKPLKTY